MKALFATIKNIIFVSLISLQSLTAQIPEDTVSHVEAEADTIPENTIAEAVENSPYDIKHNALHVQAETQVLFGSGEMQLTNKHIKYLSFLANDLQDDIAYYKESHPNEKIKVLIVVTGYSDTQPFYAGQSEQERQAMNQRLSEARAKSVGEYLKKQIQVETDVVECSIKGFGETLPKILAETKQNDPKRRVCEVYTLVYSDSNNLYTDYARLLKEINR
jgi:outer membrane protein OmpA-like peptidoglycan-associated protein